MAHKARRRPSWGKRTRSKWNSALDLTYKVMAMEVRKEIDKEILEKIRTMLPEPDGKAQDCKSLRTQFDSGR